MKKNHNHKHINLPGEEFLVVFVGTDTAFFCTSEGFGDVPDDDEIVPGLFKLSIFKVLSDVETLGVLNTQFNSSFPIIPFPPPASKSRFVLALSSHPHSSSFESGILMKL